jgi:hypothetical protein
MKKVGNGDYAHPIMKLLHAPNIDPGFLFFLGFRV